MKLSNFFYTEDFAVLLNPKMKTITFHQFTKKLFSFPATFETKCGSAQAPKLSFLSASAIVMPALLNIYPSQIPNMEGAGVLL